MFCSVSDEDILLQINIGDRVLYNGEKYYYNGTNVITNYFGQTNEYVILKKSNNTLKTSVPPNLRHKIELYDEEIDKTLIRSHKKRAEFVQDVLQCPQENIPTAYDTSVIIVMPRTLSDRILNNTTLLFDDKVIHLLEIITATYFTENGQYKYRWNRGNSEPVLKVTGKVSVARDLLIDKSGSKAIGLNIFGSDAINKGMTEIPELINRRSIKYVFLSYHIDSNNRCSIFKEYEKIKRFACTKALLKQGSLSIVANNSYTQELRTQVDSVIRKNVSPLIIEDNVEWNENNKVKRYLLSLKQSQDLGDNKDFFIIRAFSLINLFSTAIFQICDLESLIECGKIPILSPKKQIEELEYLSNCFSEEYRERANLIVVFLKKLYSDLYYNSRKKEYLDKIILNNPKKKYALIVPKAYYIDILLQDEYYNKRLRDNKMSIFTTNRFDNTTLYDEIIVMGNYKGNKFNPFRCIAAPLISVLIYDYEMNIFNANKQFAEKEELFLNNNNYSYEKLMEEDNSITEYESEEKCQIEDDIKLIYSIENELNSYINNLKEKEVLDFINRSYASSGVTTSKVEMIGTFVDGEKVLFTKGYKAYVFDRLAEDVKEVPIEELLQGDTLVFANGSVIDKDIVDKTLRELIEKNLLDKDMQNAYEMYKYWKDVLRNYMRINNLTFKGLSIQLENYECFRHEVTLRTWLDEDMHIVGPKEENVFIKIAEMTKDERMLKNPKDYYIACELIRNLRTKILKMIGKAIISKLRGIMPDSDMMLKTIWEGIENLAITLQLESISDVKDFYINVNMVNRPLIL